MIPFQHVEIGPEPIVANLRFFHSEHAGTRYLHLTFEEVIDLYYLKLAFDAIDDAVIIMSDVGRALLRQPRGETRCSASSTWASRCSSCCAATA